MIVSGDVCDALKIFPDASMCKLASLCRVDCRDVSTPHGLHLFVLTDFGRADTTVARRSTITDSCFFPGSIQRSLAMKKRTILPDQPVSRESKPIRECLICALTTDLSRLDPYLCSHDGPCTPEICVCARDDRRCCRRCSCFARCKSYTSTQS